MSRTKYVDVLRNIYNYQESPSEIAASMGMQNVTLLLKILSSGYKLARALHPHSRHDAESIRSLAANVVEYIALYHVLWGIPPTSLPDLLWVGNAIHPQSPEQYGRHVYEMALLELLESASNLLDLSVDATIETRSERTLNQVHDLVYSLLEKTVAVVSHYFPDAPFAEIAALLRRKPVF